MTPAAQEIHVLMNSMDKISEKQMSNLMLKVDKYIKPIFSIFRDLLLSNDIMFKQLFAPNFTKKEQYKIIADYLKTDVTYIVGSIERDEIVRFSLYILTCEMLAKVSDTVKHLYGLSTKEFLIIWFILNEKNSFKKIMLDKSFDLNMLDEKTRNIVMKEKQERAERLSCFEEG